MADDERTVVRLRSTLPQVGELVWIGRAALKRGPIEAVSSVEVQVGTGLVGEHHSVNGHGKRQVTLIQAEHLPVIGSLAGTGPVRPELLRRNLVVRGLNLAALRETRFSVGAVELEWTGLCDPCSRMEEALGPGGYNAMLGHGGITARVLVPGRIAVGDAVRRV